MFELEKKEKNCLFNSQYIIVCLISGLILANDALAWWGFRSCVVESWVWSRDLSYIYLLRDLSVWSSKIGTIYHFIWVLILYKPFYVLFKHSKNCTREAEFYIQTTWKLKHWHSMNWNSMKILQSIELMSCISVYVIMYCQFNEF